jgi:hypothetical protein
MEDLQPDLFIVELYPFGRSIFGFELEPLLGDIRAGKFGGSKPSAACAIFWWRKRIRRPTKKGFCKN